MIKRMIFGGMLLLMAVATLCSCKGRTMENMEPTGDTVEVEIAPASTAAETDTIPHI